MTARSRPGLPLARIDAIDDVLGRPPPPPPAAPTPRRAAAPEEPADPDQVLRDYVLAPYPPLAPVAGGLAAVNLLIESFAIAGVEAAGAAVLARLRAQLGPGRVVWGVKLNSRGLVAEPPSIPADPGSSLPPRRETGRGPALSWELYVYDPGGERPEARPAAVRAALADVLAFPALPTAPVPHHMWSLELDAAALTSGAGARLTYYTSGADTPGASRSYALADGQLALGNLYTFHDPRREPDAILARLRASVHLAGAPRGAAAVIAPGLHRCRRLCVANKRHADGLYFAGVDTDRTIGFLREHGWPAPLVGYLAERRGRLRHLAWDLALDAARGADGAPHILRTAIHASA
ncbi:MAG: hypothetical protein KA201_08480 [Kofleriaceae bacterium]|nr:hypothetical protein [Kofleriaceae bacterium]